MNEAEMNEVVSHWVGEVKGRHYFLPPCSRRHSQTCLCRWALPRRAGLKLTKEAHGAVTGDLMQRAANLLDKQNRTPSVGREGSLFMRGMRCDVGASLSGPFNPAPCKSPVMSGR